MKTIPSDLTSERALLGACLLDNSQFDEVADIVTAEDFYHAGHRAVWRAISALTIKGAGCDVVTVADAMTAAGTLSEVDGVPGLLQILESVPISEHARFYALQVAGWAKRRNLVLMASKLNVVAQDASRDVDEIVSESVSMVNAVAERGIRVGPKAVADVASEVLNGERRAGMDTGFPSVDQIGGGLRDQELTILAARPSVGKSALGAAVAWNSARTGNPTLFFSMEQPSQEIVGRLLSRDTGIVYTKFRSGLDEFDRRQVAMSGHEMSGIPFWIDDRSGRTVSEVAAISRQMQRKHGLRLVVVDYLQLMTPEDKKSPREQQVSGISRGLKHLARTLKVSVLALAQLNRQNEMRANKMPGMSDLRESGALEQDADNIWLLHRPNKDEPDKTENPDDRAIVIVAKNRNGPTGQVNIGWDGQYVSFFDPGSRPISESESSDFFDNGSQWR